MISVSFDNLDEIRDVYDPLIIDKAVRSTTRKLVNFAATEVKRSVRDKYRIKAARINKSLQKRVVSRQTGDTRGFLIYTSKRLSLANFASRTGQGLPGRSARPKVKTARGVRYGARVRVLKNRPSKVVKGAFWAPGTGGVWQIWKRETEARRPIRMLTGPSVSHMMRSAEAIQAVERTVQQRATPLLTRELDVFAQKRAGIL